MREYLHAREQRHTDEQQGDAIIQGLEKFPFGGNGLSEETRNHHLDNVDAKMPDHIRGDVASPLMEYRQEKDGNASYRGAVCY